MLINFSITIVIFSIFISVTNSQGNDCEQSLDIFFMIDGSASLGEDNFNNEKELVAQISNKLNNNDTENTEIIHRYGYIIISNSIDDKLSLTKYTDFILFLDNAAYPRSGTNVLASLQYVDNNVFNINTIRPNTQRILVLLSDGEFSESGVEAAFKNIEDADVKIIVFRFTDGVDEEQLQSIATEQNYFKFDNFIDALNSVERLGSIICPVLTSECKKKGVEGKRGKRGPYGDMGEKGDTGRCGECLVLDQTCRQSLNKGVKGPIGVRGEEGSKGEIGIKGPQGLKALKGNKGSRGQKGDVGNKGAVGGRGLPGAKGDIGEVGSKGERGQEGLKGNPGADGQKGEQGLNGERGNCTESNCIGAKGDKGELGEVGEVGVKGIKGSEGTKGVRAEQGDVGGIGTLGNDGEKGNDGNTGGVLPHKAFTEGSCDEFGSLHFDNTTNQMYYCDGNRYKCIGPGPTGNCVDCLCKLRGGETLKCNENVTRFTKPTDCTENVAVDFILIVDDSTSMAKQQNWLTTHMPILNTKLIESCIGQNPLHPNLFQLVGFGSVKTLRDPHFILPGTFIYHPPNGIGVKEQTFTINDLPNAVNRLINQINPSLAGATIENGYDALNYSLSQSYFRESTAVAQYIPVMIFLTNEDSDDYTESGFYNLLDQYIKRDTLVLAFALQVNNIITPNINGIFGVSYSSEEELVVWHSLENGTAERQVVPVGNVSVTFSNDANSYQVKPHYIDLIMCTRRSSANFWDLDFVTDDARVLQFTEAFARQNAAAIIDRATLYTCQECHCTSKGETKCLQIEEKLLCECLNEVPIQPACLCAKNKFRELLATNADISIDDVKLECNLQPKISRSDECKNFVRVS